MSKYILANEFGIIYDTSPPKNEKPTEAGISITNAKRSFSIL